MILDEKILDEFIIEALNEDVGEGDHTSLACIPADSVSYAKLLIKDEGVLAGIKIAKAVFNLVASDYEFKQLLNDGDKVRYGQVAFYVKCNTHALLKAERVCLNLMQRMSGIATLAHEFVEEVNGKVTILDTRKTTPQLRFLEKWAVSIGGASNYRSGLYDRIMIKDNHVEAAGGVGQAIKETMKYFERNNFTLPITVEVRSIEELNEVLKTGNVDRIMLDNFNIPLMKEAVALIANQFEIEASGGITLETVGAVAKTGVDYVSVGALTHSYQSLDMSLKIIDKESF